MVLPLAGAATLAALEPLARAMDQLTGAIKESYNFTQKAEKASAALGFSFGDATKKMGPSIAGLRGTIEQQWTTGLLQLDAGLKGTTAGVSKLINQQMLTGTAYKETSKAFANLQAFLGLDIDALSALATDTRELGAKYGISTDKLVKAVMTLEQQFVFLDMAGMGKSMVGAVERLKTELGAAFNEKRFNELMNIIVNTGTKGLTTLATIGIGDIRERFEGAAGSVEETFQMLRSAVISGGSNLAAMVGTTSKQFGAFTSVLDKGAENFISASRILQEGVEINTNANTRFADLMSTLWSEVWNPLKKFVVSLQPKMNQFAKVLSSVIQGMVGGLARLLETMEPSNAVFENFLKGIIDVGIGITDWGLSLGLKIKNVVVNLFLPAIFKIIDGLVGLAITIGEFIESAKDGFVDFLVGGVATVGAGAAMAAWLSTPFGLGSALALGIAGGFAGVEVGEHMGGAQERNTQAIKSVEAAFEKVGMKDNWKNLLDANKLVEGQVKKTVGPMEKIKDSINFNAKAWRDQANSLIEAAQGTEENTAEIAAKTADAFLGITDAFVEESMAQILGFGPKETDGYLINMVESLDDLVEITTVAADGGNAPVQPPKVEANGL